MTCHCYEHKCIFFCQEHFKFEYTSALHVKMTILLQTENDETDAVKTNPGNTDEIQVIMFVLKKKKKGSVQLFSLQQRMVRLVSAILNKTHTQVEARALLILL